MQMSIEWHEIELMTKIRYIVWENDSIYHLSIRVIQDRGDKVVHVGVSNVVFELNSFV